MKSGNISRLRLVYGLFLFLLICLVSRLVVVQIVSGDYYRERTNHQYISREKGVFDRGSIYFTEENGEKRSAAMVKSGYRLSINPSIIDDANSIYQALSAILPIDEVSFLAKAAKKDDVYEEIARKIDNDTARQISALDLTGVSLSKDSWRFYPAGDTAAHVLGFVGYRGNELVGQYGLERYYDDVLSRGVNDLYVNVFAEIFSNMQFFDRGDGEDDKKGEIATSIEPSVQNELENQLTSVMKKWSSDSAGGIIMDPKTGEIYAMASLPDFDPNSYNTVSDTSVYPNPIVESVYEMGSIFKPLTMAAGIDSGAVTPETTYHDYGHVIVDGARISNYDGRGRGVINMQRVLSESLNTGAVFVMESMGKDTFRKYMLSYGLGEETGIDLPHETPGLVSNLESKRTVEYATASFGQGVAVTPIEMIRALGALANNGVLVNPHIVTEIDYENGTVKKIIPFEGKRVLKKTTTDQVTKMLINVVDDALAGGTVKLDNYSIAAKTGTAQIARPSDGGYYKDRYLHSFFGYFPAYKPRFIVFLYTVYPKGTLYASHTLTEPFMNIAKFLLNYYQVPPDR